MYEKKYYVFIMENPTTITSQKKFKFRFHFRDGRYNVTCLDKSILTFTRIITKENGIVGVDIQNTYI